MGGFYVGSGSPNSNIAVNLDGCTIEGQTYAFTLAGSGSEANNTVNLSNCTLVDGESKVIYIQSDTSRVNVGIGCAITSNMATLPDQLSFSNRLYRKIYENKALDGKDFNALVTALMLNQ